MIKIAVFLTLFTCYVVYSATVYSKGTNDTTVITPEEQIAVTRGKLLYEKNNCTSCHQIYGLGGYLGPELTTAYSDPSRGEQFMRAFLMAGGPRMPNFHFKKEEVDALISYFKYIDASAVSYKKPIHP